MLPLENGLDFVSKINIRMEAAASPHLLAFQ